MKILILDDDPFVLKLLAVQLRSLALHRNDALDVVAFESGDAATAALEADHDSVDVVFCDLQMPGMDGIEFVRQLVKIGYRGGLVLVSGEDERVVQAAGRLAQVHDLNVLGALQKPVATEDLQKILDGVLPAAAMASRPAEVQPRGYTPDELRSAIAAGQLFNHYQPKVDLASGAVVGVEALVRWAHPDDGLVMPFRFIDLAEQAGLIGEVGAVVLDNALADLRRWHDHGRMLDMSVNVSMASLLSLQFPEFVASRSAAAGVPLSHLILEITESRLMENPRQQLDILTRLRLKHVRLSIDDFGTGYSGLAQLRSMPFAELKIDRSFVHRASHDQSLRAILDASVALASQLGLKTVAEGVEEREDWDLLRACGCDLAQGYLVARPMAAEQFEPWLVEWESRRAELSPGTSVPIA